MNVVWSHFNGHIIHLSVPPKEESKVSILAEMAPAPPEDPMEDSEELSLANISDQISDQLQQGHISAKIDIGSSSSQPAFASSTSSNISSSSSSSIGSSSSISSTSSAPGATNNAQVSGKEIKQNTDLTWSLQSVAKMLTQLTIYWHLLDELRKAKKVVCHLPNSPSLHNQ